MVYREPHWASPGGTKDDGQTRRPNVLGGHGDRAGQSKAPSPPETLVSPHRRGDELVRDAGPSDRAADRPPQGHLPPRPYPERVGPPELGGEFLYPEQLHRVPPS